MTNGLTFEAKAKDLTTEAKANGLASDAIGLTSEAKAEANGLTSEAEAKDFTAEARTKGLTSGPKGLISVVEAKDLFSEARAKGTYCLFISTAGNTTVLRHFHSPLYAIYAALFIYTTMCVNCYDHYCLSDS